jgi:ABC-type protease/lipase transport system fused ATPase/permease subunit
MSVSALTKRWPGREEQIQRLVNGASTAGAPLLFVYGPSSTGKTSVVRQGLFTPFQVMSSGMWDTLDVIIATLLYLKRRLWQGRAA